MPDYFVHESSYVDEGARIGNVDVGRLKVAGIDPAIDSAP